MGLAASRLQSAAASTRPGQAGQASATLPKRAGASGVPQATGGTGGNPEAATSSLPPREDHDATQAAYFARNVKAIRQSITPRVEEQLARVAATPPGLGPSSRVVDVGAGEGALINHLQALGVRDVLAVDVCPEMLEALQKRVGGAPSTLGNEPGVRTWLGDVQDLPAYQGPFDAAFFNSVFGNLHDPHEALLRTCLLLRPGSHVVISHPLGRKWLERYAQTVPDIVPHSLPTKEQLLAMTADLPLQLESFTDDEDIYLALLKVPEGYACSQAPVYLEGAVTTGFGRGSKQLGVPTANLPPEPLKATLGKLPSGVFFGWARLDAGPDAPPEDSAVHPMVCNVGRRPTFEDATPQLTVEVHVLHRYAEDFYGKRLRAVAVGYIRPEMKFNGVDDLLARIKTDIGIAKVQLELPQWQEYRQRLEAGEWSSA